MARTFHRPRRISALNEINMTPLIDLAFALLIIFIISTPLLEQTIPLNLPLERRAAETTERPRFVALSVDREGQLYFEREALSDAELNRRLAELALQPDPPVLHIRGDREIAYQRIIDLLNLVKANGLSRISLDTTLQ